MDTKLLFILSAGLLVAGIGTALAILLARLFRSPQRHQVSADWLHRFSVERYRVMERLLSKEDFDFLKSQQGYHPSLEQRLRRDRHRIFRSYLKTLRQDFRRLESVLLLLMTAAGQDRPDLAQGLIRRRLLFHWAVLMVQWRLLLFRLGVTGSVDALRLLGELSGLRLDLGHLVLARQAAAS